MLASRSPGHKPPPEETPPRAGATNPLAGRVLTVAFATVFLDLVGYGLIIPLLPLYVQSMGGSAAVVGFILTSFALAQLVATPVLGRLSDRYGRRRVIVLSLVGNALSMAVFALATELHLLALLFVSRMVAGVTAGNMAACQAAVADVTAPADRSRAMGRIGAGIGLGLVVGPVMGSALSRFGAWAPPAGAGVLAVCALVLALVMLPETRHVGAPAATPSTVPSRSALGLVTQGPLSFIVGITFLTFIALSTVQATLALLASERVQWGPEEIGYVFALFGLITLVVQGGLIGPLSRRFGEERLVVVGSGMGAIGMMVIAVGYTPAMIVAGSAVFGAGVACVNPSITSMASRFAPPDRQGATLGLTQSAGGLARTVGPTWAGFLFAQMGSGSPFVSAATASFVALLVGLALRARTASDLRGSSSAGHR